MLNAHSQRAQRQSPAARKAKRKRSRLARGRAVFAEAAHRFAFSPFEFGHILGKSETWAYRQLYSGALKAIPEAGRILIPRSELERFLARATVYNPKPKRKKENGKEPSHEVS